MDRNEIERLRQLAHDVTHETLHGPLPMATVYDLASGLERLAERTLTAPGIKLPEGWEWRGDFATEVGSKRFATPQVWEDGGELFLDHDCERRVPVPVVLAVLHQAGLLPSPTLTTEQTTVGKRQVMSRGCYLCRGQLTTSGQCLTPNCKNSVFPAVTTPTVPHGVAALPPCSRCKGTGKEPDIEKLRELADTVARENLSRWLADTDRCSLPPGATVMYLGPEVTSNVLDVGLWSWTYGEHDGFSSTERDARETVLALEDALEVAAARNETGKEPSHDG